MTQRRTAKRHAKLLPVVVCVNLMTSYWLTLTQRVAGVIAISRLTAAVVVVRLPIASGSPGSSRLAFGFVRLAQPVAASSTAMTIVDISAVRNMMNQASHRLFDPERSPYTLLRP